MVSPIQRTYFDFENECKTRHTHLLYTLARDSGGHWMCESPLFGTKLLMVIEWGRYASHWGTQRCWSENPGTHQTPVSHKIFKKFVTITTMNNTQNPMTWYRGRGKGDVLWFFGPSQWHISVSECVVRNYIFGAVISALVFGHWPVFAVARMIFLVQREHLP